MPIWCQHPSTTPSNAAVYATDTAWHTNMTWDGDSTLTWHGTVTACQDLPHEHGIAEEHRHDCHYEWSPSACPHTAVGPAGTCKIDSIQPNNAGRADPLSRHKTGARASKTTTRRHARMLARLHRALTHNCMHVRTHARKHHARTHHTHTRAHARTHARSTPHAARTHARRSTTRTGSTQHAARTHACTHARTHARMRTRTHARTHACTHACTHQVKSCSTTEIKRVRGRQARPSL